MRKHSRKASVRSSLIRRRSQWVTQRQRLTGGRGNMSVAHPTRKSLARWTRLTQGPNTFEARCIFKQDLMTRQSGASKELLLLPEKIRSEEHTSELQSRLHLVCRLLLEKK